MVQFWLMDYHLQCLPQSLSMSKTSVANSIPMFAEVSSPLTYRALVVQWFPTLCDPMNSSPSSSSIHGIFQARILEWAAISFFRGSSQTRDRAQVYCIAGRLFTVWATREAPKYTFWLRENITGPLSSVQFSHSVVSNSVRLYRLQLARLPCPSPIPGACSDSWPLSQWCHPNISSSVIPSPPAFNLSQHQGLFQWVSSSYKVAKVLELQLQHQSFQCIFGVDFL